ncbi:MAG: hypothetical protein U0V45_09255 [Flavobacteriales bacterium]|jgi:hypothetical protein|nr:hypothetical protein [Flavobacteriales bacterium]HNA32989.1 hypothetical protein [Flavobacteriales bacterium]HNM70960.1 hypothetical protein [Flavobacteriales bacterium]
MAWILSKRTAYVEIVSSGHDLHVWRSPGEHRYTIGPNAECVPFAQLEKLM